jgi:hypothetical protein
MAKLIHEIWETFDDRGDVLPGVCLAGPDGDGFRKLQDGNARCVRRFEAGSHFEAMTIYHHHYGWGEYTTDQAWDHQPYPEDWAERQRSGS